MDNPPRSVEPESAADHAAEDSLFHREVLNELIAMGNDLARMIHGQAKDQAAARYPDEGVADVTVAFERVCLTIRRTVLLARKVAEALPVRAAERRAAVRQQIARAVEDSIRKQASGDEAARLRCELGDRLERAELVDAIDSRPVLEIIAEIRRDLGVAGAEMDGAGVGAPQGDAVAAGGARAWRDGRPLFPPR